MNEPLFDSYPKPEPKAPSPLEREQLNIDWDNWKSKVRSFLQDVGTRRGDKLIQELDRLSQMELFY